MRDSPGSDVGSSPARWVKSGNPIRQSVPIEGKQHHHMGSRGLLYPNGLCMALTSAFAQAHGPPMAGRTERVNARDLLDRADVIMFEGDTCRDWIEKLAKRMALAIESAKQNSYFENEFKADYEELVAVQDALTRAERSLAVLGESVRRREGKAA